VAVVAPAAETDSEADLACRFDPRRVLHFLQSRYPWFTAARLEPFLVATEKYVVNINTQRFLGRVAGILEAVIAAEAADRRRHWTLLVTQLREVIVGPKEEGRDRDTEKKVDKRTGVNVSQSKDAGEDKEAKRTEEAEETEEAKEARLVRNDQRLKYSVYLFECISKIRPTMEQRGYMKYIYDRIEALGMVDEAGVEIGEEFGEGGGNGGETKKSEKKGMGVLIQVSILFVFCVTCISYLCVC
jgi:hypothetical protein